MAKSKFVELVFADDARAPKHSLTGYLTVSDYRADGLRHVFMRLPDADVAVPAKPRQRRKRQAKAQPAKADGGSQTAFPGTVAANG